MEKRRFKTTMIVLTRIQHGLSLLYFWLMDLRTSKMEHFKWPLAKSTIICWETYHIHAQKKL